MRFTSVKPDKMVMFGGKVIKFRQGSYDTEDKAEIELLKKVSGVEAEKKTRPASAE